MKIKIFQYIENLDAFHVTKEYAAISDKIGLREWNPVVWIGRLFALDNDYGEHWFDNWELRQERGLEEGQWLLIDPDRFQDGRDGPCHTPAFRKRFWTNVLESLTLDLELLFDEARALNAQRFALGEPDTVEADEDLITDLEARIQSLRDGFSSDFA